jgi:hypothetical protein
LWLNIKPPPPIARLEKLRMNKRLKKFLWTPAFWALLGLFGCGTGLYFQQAAENGMGLWFLGLMFLGVAYLERTP